MIGDWLLCDFHIHTRFGDGKLQLPQVVDLYGTNGFDVIAITDHVLDSRTISLRHQNGNKLCAIEETAFQDYVQTLWREARRAWEDYKMMLLPGIEITNNTKMYHILAIDIKRYISPDLSVVEIVKEIHKQGAIAIACHPHKRCRSEEQQSAHLWKNHREFADLFDAWEVANRDDLFSVIGLKKFRYVANSDFHLQRHLYSWKTLLMCEKNPEGVKDSIRRNGEVGIYLHRKT